MYIQNLFSTQPHSRKNLEKWLIFTQIKSKNKSMEYQIRNYNWNGSPRLVNYRVMYSGLSSAEQRYHNLIKYIPDVTHTGEYLTSN